MQIELIGVESMFNTIKIYFLLFLIYSFFGWCMEVCVSLIERKKFVNRGFLLGPYCPIYGSGAILITILLTTFKDRPILLFFMAILVCGILEYLTSFIMEKIFRFRWWDYSKKKFNINGRVCLNTIIPFGILGMVIMYITNPFLLDKIYMLPQNILNIIFYITLIIYIIDNIISLTTIFGIRSTTTKVNRENREDNTEEITKKVREILLGKSFVQRRLVNAYPKLQAIKIKVKEKIEQTKEEIEKQKEILDKKVDKAKEELNRKIRDIENKRKE